MIAGVAYIIFTGCLIMGIYSNPDVGVYVSAFGRVKWLKALAIGGGFSLLIEVLQFVFKRGFSEFDDVFHNVLGCAIGFGLYVLAAWFVGRIRGKSGMDKSNTLSALTRSDSRRTP